MATILVDFPCCGAHYELPVRLPDHRAAPALSVAELEHVAQVMHDADDRPCPFLHDEDDLSKH